MAHIWRDSRDSITAGSTCRGANVEQEKRQRVQPRPTLGKLRIVPHQRKDRKTVRDQESILPHVDTLQRAYNAGVGGSNPSPPTTRRSRSPSTFRSSGVSTHSRWCLLNPTKIPQTCAEESLRACVCCFAATLRSAGDPTNPTWGSDRSVSRAQVRILGGIQTKRVRVVSAGQFYQIEDGSGSPAAFAVVPR
jgi:hypothetical protein